jgi:hypothetical protein
MFKLANKRIFHISFVFFSWISLLPIFSVEEELSSTEVHVLMPVYNAKAFLPKSISSVLSQTYPNLKLLMLDDGSTDGSRHTVEELTRGKPNVDLLATPANAGVSRARSTLLSRSMELNPGAYRFWLDADDRYTDDSFINKVMQQMKATAADICLYNFSIIFEDPSQEANAKGLFADRDSFRKILEQIELSPTGYVTPLDVAILKVTSLGWVKAFAPTIRLPNPANCAFEDFVFMKALLDAHRITAMPPGYEPIEYLRRSTSICGQRKPTHFTHDIPLQLETFFAAVINNKDTDGYEKKIEMAKDFVHMKLEQYESLLLQLIETQAYSEITLDVLDSYRKSSTQLRGHIRILRK